MVGRGRWRVVVRSVVSGRRRTPVGGRGGLGKCRAAATCVGAHGPYEPPGDRHRRRNTLACRATWGAVHSSRAGRKKELGKNFCCVTTRRRNCGWLWCLRRRGGALTARPLGLGVLDFYGFILAPFGLPFGRLPATDLALAFGVLAVTLVPAPWQILLATAFAQANPGPRSSRTGTAAAIWTTITATHGSVCYPKGQPEGNALTFSSGAYQNPKRGTLANLYFRARTRQ